MKITTCTVRTVRLAVGRRSLTAPAALPTDAVTLELTTDAGLIGRGYSIGPTLAPLVEGWSTLLVGESAFHRERIAEKVRRATRAYGWGGLFARAFAAIDLALWDLAALAANKPIHALLGGARDDAPSFRGDLAATEITSDDTLAAMKPLRKKGVLGVLAEVGGADVAVDADRVQEIRHGLGEDAWLGITAEGRYDLNTALAMSHFYEEDISADWIEHPLPIEDHHGYSRLAARAEAPIALGATFDTLEGFRRTLEAGHARILRPDVLRLGGLTTFLKVAALAEAYPVLLAPYRSPEIGLHLACGLPSVQAVECGAWTQGLFETTPIVGEGTLPAPTAAGWGWTFRS